MLNLLDPASLELVNKGTPNLVCLYFSGANNPESENVPDIHAVGQTLLQALANLETAIIGTFGIEAAFSNEDMFRENNPGPLEALATIGGIYQRNDFSTPESNYQIERIETPN